MVRPKRVLSFMSEWGGSSPHRRTPSQATSPVPQSPAKQASFTTLPSDSVTALDNYDRQSPTPATRPRSDTRASQRPMSMIQTYQPPVMEVSTDTLPELQRIFTFLNSHSNKLYQEGYFLKFHDTDSRGRPAPDRVWQECFAQLVGTILSLWDASELDKVGGDAEVLPTFINLTDAAIHMMPSMTLSDGKRLDNILSVSTAASNKYLFHFNSFNSLTQWTAGIRLAMYEHTTLQEAYTGALIAGKGKSLNNIRIILDRQRARHEDWARVRFGAGTPWRRCWCVVSPPDEKEYAKLRKNQKKGNIYMRQTTVLKGDIKFYDSKKITKKTRPIATVKDAYSCYAIYPQSKPLIDQSTLVKIEGQITIHSNPETVTEGFVFVMPETHPAVSGFEIMLRFLFPVFDTFALYGRPDKLVSDVLDTRGLMFAMPPDRRYGYLEMWDVVSLIHEEGSGAWPERQWRKQLKDLTSKRMTATPTRGASRTGSRRNTVSRTSLPPSRSGTLRFEERGSIRSQPSTRQVSPVRQEFEPQGPRRVDSAPPVGGFATPKHQRSVSEAHGYKQYQTETPSRLAYNFNPQSELESPPTPPEHQVLNGTPVHPEGYETDTEDRPSPEMRDLPELQIAPTAPPHGPVASPPTFAHAPGQRPPVAPQHPPMMTKPNTQMDPATLHQLADATHTPLPAGVAAAGAAAAWRGQQDSSNGYRNGDYDRRVDDRNPMQDANAQYLGAPTSRSGQSGNRLPTIPASPYVEHTEFVDSPTAYQPAAPPVPEHAELPPTQPSSVELAHRPPPGSGSGSGSIQRKPVPGPSPAPLREEFDNRSTTSSSLGSLRNNVIDPEILDNLARADALLQRHNSKSSSRYDDDAASTSTPDYASVYSQEVKPRTLPTRREDRPRSGVLKYVGNATSATPKPDVVVGDAHYNPDLDVKPSEFSADIPSIDFGPTYALSPDAKRPGTSGTMTQALHDSPSRSRENNGLSREEKRESWIASKTTPIAASHMRSSSASPNLLESRTVAWQPAIPNANQSHIDRPKLDPEEWVQVRAGAGYPNRTSPVYGHGRSKSHTPPPMVRNHSGDWSHLQRTPEAMPARPPSRPLESPVRPPSRPLSRPLSRGAGHLLDQRPISLSAREQEQAARLTGTPLIDLTKNPKKEQKPSSGGLVSYVDHREKEKAAAKKAGNTAAMQAEIDRRIQQRQMMEMQQMQQMQQQQMNQSQLAMAQGFSTPPLMGTPSVMGAPSAMGAPSVMGAPSMMGSPQGYSQAFAYSAPNQMQQRYQQQQQQQQMGYFPQQGMSPSMQQNVQPRWGSSSPQPMQGSPQMQQQPLQAYGASFDQRMAAEQQAQAAARFAHQQQFRRQ